MVKSRDIDQLGLPWWLSGKECTSQCRTHGLIPELGRCPGEGNSNLLQLPGEFHGQGSLRDYSLQGHR